MDFPESNFPKYTFVVYYDQVCSLKVLDLVGDHSVCGPVVDSDTCSQ